MDLKEKLNLLPSTITYKLPVSASGATDNFPILLGRKIWGEKEGIYELDIKKTEDNRWEIFYTHYNIYEGYPEVYLPVKTDEEIMKIVRDEYGIGEDEDFNWIITPDDLYAEKNYDNLEDAVDSVLGWLRKEGILS